MRKRSGRFVDHKAIKDFAYEVEVPLTFRPTEQDERTRFIRSQCRRADWSKAPHRTFSMSNGETKMTYLFVDQEDAMYFKMRFG